MLYFFIFLSLFWVIIGCSEFKGFEYTPNEKGKMTGQTLLLAVAGSLFTINLLMAIGLYKNNLFRYKPSVFYLYLVLHIIFIILWVFSNLWLTDGAKWGPWDSMNEWAKFNTIFVSSTFILCIIFLIGLKYLNP